MSEKMHEALLGSEDWGVFVHTERAGPATGGHRMCTLHVRLTLKNGKRPVEEMTFVILPDSHMEFPVEIVRKPNGLAPNKASLAYSFVQVDGGHEATLTEGEKAGQSLLISMSDTVRQRSQTHRQRQSVDTVSEHDRTSIDGSQSHKRARRD